MRITARGLNRSTLGRQMRRRESLGVSDAVRRVVAQQAASPYRALWNRITDFDMAHLDAAFAGHDVVKATLMRITLHAVHAEDYRAFREAMEPTLRASRPSTPRFVLDLAELDTQPDRTSVLRHDVVGDTARD